MGRGITTFEANQQYGLSTSHLRRLLTKGSIKGREAQINTANKIWLIDEGSLKKYLRTKPKPGPKPTKK